MLARNVISAFVGAAIVGAAWVATAALQRNRDIHPQDGTLKVDYMVQSSPTTAEGSQVDRVSAIEFHPAYIIVKSAEDRGVVFFPERTRNLSWHR